MPPTAGLLFFGEKDVRSWRLDKRKCVHRNKNGNAKIKNQQYELWCSRQRYRLACLPEKWSHPIRRFFSGSDPSPTAAIAVAATSTIVPGAHIPTLGQKQHTKPFSPVNMKKMDKKGTINTNPDPEAPAKASVDASTRSPGFIVSNYPYSLRNRNFHATSNNAKKPEKDKNHNWW